jgi:hypothetical protein
MATSEAAGFCFEFISLNFACFLIWQAEFFLMLLLAAA